MITEASMSDLKQTFFGLSGVLLVLAALGLFWMYMLAPGLFQGTQFLAAGILLLILGGYTLVKIDKEETMEKAGKLLEFV